MSWLVHWVFYAFFWISRKALAAWPCTSVSLTFLTLLTVKTGFEPVIAWIVELLTLLNGRLSLLSPRNRREYFSSSLLGSFLMQAFWSCARRQIISPIPSRNTLVARESEMCNRIRMELRRFSYRCLSSLCITVVTWDTSSSQRDGCSFNSCVWKRFGSDFILSP